MFSGNVSLKSISANNLPNNYPSLNTFMQIKIDGFEVFRTVTAKDTFDPDWKDLKDSDINIVEKTLFSDVEHISFTIHDDDEKKGIIAECTLSFDYVLIEQIGRDSLKIKQSLTPQG